MEIVTPNTTSPLIIKIASSTVVCTISNTGDISTNGTITSNGSTVITNATVYTKSEVDTKITTSFYISAITIEFNSYNRIYYDFNRTYQ